MVHPLADRETVAPETEAPVETSPSPIFTLVAPNDAVTALNVAYTSTFWAPQDPSSRVTDGLAVQEPSA